MTERLSESFIDEALMRKIGITAFLSGEPGLHDFTISPWGPRETITSPIAIGRTLLTTIEITHLIDDSNETLVNIQTPTAEGATLYDAHVEGPRNERSSVVRVDSHGREVYRYEPSEEFALRLARLAFKSIERQNAEVMVA